MYRRQRSYSTLLGTVIEEIMADMDGLLCECPEHFHDHTHISKSSGDPHHTKALTPPYNKKDNGFRRGKSRSPDAGQAASRAESEAQAQAELEKRLVQEQNFKNWLAQKLEQERKIKRAKKEFEEKQERIKAEEEQLKKELSDLSRSVWLRGKFAMCKALKEQQAREKEKSEQLERQRKELSQKKVNEWMQKSQSRARPVSQGIGSSLPSVSFINPLPWRNILEQ